MRKVGVLMLMIGLSIISFYFMYVKTLNTREAKAVEQYISETKTIQDEVNVESTPVEEIKKSIGKEINYTAVLEIPSINLKNGVVDSTTNFKSINYAISVDNHSNYPDKQGNFILYAHSGTSSIAFFKNLTKVNINDDVYVYYNGTKYQYKIVNKYDIEKTGKASVKGTEKRNYITLITCNQSRKGYQIVLEGILISEANY